MSHRAAACLILATLAVRALIPLGYMPGNLLAGEYMVLCPAGMPQSMIASGHHEHHEPGEESASAEQACPIGSALQLAAVPTPDFPEISVSGTYATQIRELIDVTGTSAFHHYLSRAPPRQKPQAA
jgi:hypothetical protein